MSQHFTFAITDSRVSGVNRMSMVRVGVRVSVRFRVSLVMATL